MELITDMLAYSTAASGQPSETGDAQVRRHEPADSEAQAASLVSEISEGIMGVPFTTV